MDQEQPVPSSRPGRQKRMAIAEEYPSDADRGIGANYVSDAGEGPGEANHEESNQVLEMLTEALNRISSGRPQHGPECSIYRVPHDIRQYDHEAYTPKVVSIGPYHYSPNSTSNGHTKHPYLDMQACKFRCLHSFISQQGHLQEPGTEEPNRVESLLGRCFLLVKRHEARIKSYYADEISFTADGFAGLIMLDACFILHLLLGRDQYSVPGRVWIWTLVKHDLLLLENQIPFFILYELRCILATGGDTEVDLVQKALDLFQHIHPPATKSFSPERIQNGQVLHLLHLFYLSRLPDPPSLPPRLPESSTPLWIPSATELTDLGVKFKDNNNKAKSFLDINFTGKGVMEIPSLLIDDHSRNLFRNLIAFEQCYPHTGCHITVYAAFMDCIINTDKDLRLLHLNGVIVNRMSADQDLTRFFGRLCTGVHFAKDRFYIANVFADATEYAGDACNRCRAEFMRTYCSNSWAVFAGVVSVIFFVLTFLQTFFTIFPYYNPRG